MTLKLDFEANIFPKISVPESRAELEAILHGLPQLEEFFLNAPLGQFPVATLGPTEFYSGLEYSTESVESYQFVVTRRFRYNEEWHVGGANGEVLNVFLLISNMERAAKDKLALLDAAGGDEANS